MAWELRTWSHKMNLLDILPTSPHYLRRKWIGATNENLIAPSEQRVNPSNLIAPSELPDTYLCELTLADAVGQRSLSIDKLWPSWHPRTVFFLTDSADILLACSCSWDGMFAGIRFETAHKFQDTVGLLWSLFLTWRARYHWHQFFWSRVLCMSDL